MIINQETPEIKAYKNGSSTSVASFNNTHVWFSNYAVAEFGLKDGLFVSFEYKSKSLFMIIDNDKRGFKISYTDKRKLYLKIESKPLMVYLKRNHKIHIPGRYSMKQVEGIDNKIQIIISKPNDKIE